MFKHLLKIIPIIVLAVFFLCKAAYANEITFDNERYVLKFSALSPITNGYINEYVRPNETIENWTKLIGVFYYPNEDNPIKFAQKFDKQIEGTENSLLLKLVENKKENKAIISFIVNGQKDGKKYFEYNIFKYEKHPTQGIVAFQYAQKYTFTDDKDIKNVANKIKEENDKYIALVAASMIPAPVEKDIEINN